MKLNRIHVGVILLGVIVLAMAYYKGTSYGTGNTSTSSSSGVVTEHGVVQEIISDCPPSPPSQSQTCTVFDIFVLRADSGKTYLLTNFPKAVANVWKNQTVSITGYLTSPNTSNFSFVDGDLYVEGVTAG